MRIVGGELRGKKLNTPVGLATRPTTDRVRESLFNILTNRIDFEGINVLDLFAGTGALGFEALSRGADFCLFVEIAKPAHTIIKSNIIQLGVSDRASLSKADAARLQSVEHPQVYDLVFADPPYRMGLGEKAAASLVENGWLADNAIFILEEDKSAMPEVIDKFERLDVRTYGGTTLGLFKFLG